MAWLIVSWSARATPRSSIHRAVSLSGERPIASSSVSRVDIVRPPRSVPDRRHVRVHVEDVVGIPFALERGEADDLRLAVDPERLLGTRVAVPVRIGAEGSIRFDD